MKKYILTILMLSILILAGCNNTTTGQITKENEEIIIGAILPMTGIESVVGEQSRNGLIMAVEEINKQGGINGQKVKLIIEDYKSETKEAANAYNYLKNVYDVPIIITVGSPAAMTITPLAERDKTILFAFASAPSYSKLSNFAYRMVPPATKEGKTMAEFTYNKLGYKNINIIYLNNDFGVGTKNGFLKSYEALGGKIKIIDQFNSNDKDFKTQLTKIKQNSDPIFIASWGKQAGMIAKQARELKIDVPLLCGQACQNPDLITQGEDAVENLIYPFIYANRDSDFFRRYKLIHNKETTQISERMYDFAKISSTLIGNCGSENKQCILNQLQSTQFQGNSIKIKFDNIGDPIEDFVLYTVKNGEFVLYE